MLSKEMVTKEELWLLLGAYANHIGDTEGVLYLESAVRVGVLSQKDADLVEQAVLDLYQD
jgi:hypothetical protein